jgi:hypothetical protein
MTRAVLLALCISFLALQLTLLQSAFILGRWSMLP